MSMTFLRKEETMTTSSKVKRVMELWKIFCGINGGRNNMNLNIYSKWPGFLKEQHQGD